MISAADMQRRRTTREDLEIILNELREFSRNELMIVAGTEEEALEDAVDGSRDIWSGYVKDQLALIYGVRLVSIVNNHAYVWMLTTKLVEEHWVTFVRVSSLYVLELLEQYEKISVIAPFKSKVSQRWLKYIGFSEEGKTRLYGIKFKTYSMTRSPLNEEKIHWLRGDGAWPQRLG